MDEQSELQLVMFLKGIKSDKSLDALDEAATKQGVILRILSLLGWNTYDVNEVRPEFSVSGIRVDYALRQAGKSRVFLEVKRVGEDLEKHQEQLLSYAFKQGVSLAVLTNGITWSFYLPLQEGSWNERKFYTADARDQSPVDVMARMKDYLSRDSVVSGEAVELAKSVLSTRQREYEISNALPHAWEKLMSEPNERLVDLVADDTERLCGYRPDAETVKNFLASFVPGSVEDVVLRVAQEHQEVAGDKSSKKTLDYVLRNATPSLRDLFYELRKRILAMGENVREVPNNWYCDYRKSSTFATIKVQTQNNRLRIYIKMGDREISDPAKWTSPIPETWGYAKLNTSFQVADPSQIEYATGLLQQAYDYVP